MVSVMVTDMDKSLMDIEQVVSEKKGTKKTRLEKSRCAAKARRDKENVEMQKLMEELPVDEEVLNKLDKTTVIKIAISYIKLKHYVQKDMLTFSQKNGLTGGSSEKRLVSLTDSSHIAESQVPVVSEGEVMLEALNGFLIFISKKGRIIFISPSVEEHLGIKQANMISNSIIDFIHPGDKAEFVKQLSLQADQDCGQKGYSDIPGNAVEDRDRRLFYLRMKYVVSKGSGKSKQTGYTLVQWSGKLKTHFSIKNGSTTIDGLLCVCRPMQTTSIMEIRMDGNMFMSRHGLDMRFTFCDTRIITLIGYEPSEVIGKTAYQFHNPIDALKVSDCHSNLIVKGTSVSKYYRFLGKTGRWVWLQTRATIIYNTSNKPQYVVAMNYVISEEEGERCIMLEKTEAGKMKGTSTSTSATECGPVLPLDTSPTSPSTTTTPATNPSTSSTASLTVSPEASQPEKSNFINNQVSGWSEITETTPPSSHDSEILDNAEVFYPAIESCHSNHAGSEDAGYESGYSPSSASSFNHSPQSHHDTGIDATDKDLTYYQNGTATNMVGNFQSDTSVNVPVSNNTATDSLDLLGDSCSYSGECFHSDPLLQDTTVSTTERMDILDELLESFCQPATLNNTPSFAESGYEQQSKVNKGEECGAVSSEVIPSAAYSLAGGSCASIGVTGGRVTTTLPMTPGQNVGLQKASSPPKIGGKSLLRSLFDMEAMDIRPPPLSLNSNFFKRDGNVISAMSSLASVPIRSAGPVMSQGQKVPQYDKNTSRANKMSSMPGGVAAEGNKGSIDGNGEIPVDLSDFALQYLEGLPESQAQSVITDLDSDVLMDIDDQELSKMAYELNQMVTQALDIPYQQQSPCVRNTSSSVGVKVGQGSVNGQQGNGLVKVMSQGVANCSTSTQYTLSDTGSKEVTLCSVQQSRGRANGMKQFQIGRRSDLPQLDHGYYQIPSAASSSNISTKTQSQTLLSAQKPKCYNGEYGVSGKSMSELEKRLRGINGHSVSKGECYEQQQNSKTLLQMFLTGELSQDRYHQMEQDRCNGLTQRACPL